MAKQQAVTISAPNFKTGVFKIRGVAPLVLNKFSAKARQMMKDKMEAGSTAKKGGKREAKDFQECWQQARHISEDGWDGIPAPAFRNAMISACRVCGFQMTRGKLAVFVEADGFDADDSTPLVKITKGKPEYFESLVKNQTGVADIRPRPKWKPGWEADIRVRFDADMFTLADVSNLLLRAGLQVGVGEGRPDSRMSTGQGWGMFEIISESEKKK